jgi:hypothetical protein
MRRALELAADIVLSLWQHDKQHLREKALRPRYFGGAHR